MNSHERRLRRLQIEMGEHGIEVFVVEDTDSIFYFSGYWGYMGMEYGRATLLVVPLKGEPTLITPFMESDMAAVMTWIPDIRPWADGEGHEWVDTLRPLLSIDNRGGIAIETGKTHPRVAAVVQELAGGERTTDGTALIDNMRMVKDADEIATMRQAGEVGAAMMTAAREALGEGVPEYELWLAASRAGTWKAAQLLGEDKGAHHLSPLIQGLPPIQSGHDTAMVHRRASTKCLDRGDPVYLCFCGLVTYRVMKLGFDRQFFIGEVNDELGRMTEGALVAQMAALNAIRPGALAEEVHFAAEQAYRDAGFQPSYRTGRGIGHSRLEPPELKPGDQTILQAGMTFAVDGGVTVRARGGGRVGDSIVVTESGFDYLTNFPKGILIV